MREEAFEERGVFAQAVEQRTVGDADGLHEILDERELGFLQGDEAVLLEAELHDPASGVAGGRGLQRERGGGQDALGEIVKATRSVPRGDEQAAVEEKFLERGFGQGGGAPDAAGAARGGESVGVERAAGVDLGEEPGREFAFAGREAAGPRAGALGATGHGREEMRPRSEGKGGEVAGEGMMMLERRTRGGGENRIIAMQVAHEVAFTVAGHAVAQDEIVHAAADVDRIDLHIAEMRDHAGDGAGGRIDQRGPAQEAAGGLGGDGEEGWHHRD